MDSGLRPVIEDGWKDKNRNLLCRLNLAAIVPILG